MYEILQGNCLDVMSLCLEDNSVDSIVTDPPYGLSFMGKKWDYDVPSEEIWRECLRVLKPGGHLLAFAGTRTQHRMAVRIEDAGFEIRDMIAWVYSTGFPKSMNLDRQKGEVFCGCERTGKEKAERDVRFVRDTDVSPSAGFGEGGGQVLQQSVQEQGTPVERREQFPASEIRAGQPCMEGRGNSPKAQGELRAGSVRTSTSGRCDHGEEGWLCDGASLGDGEVDRPDSSAERGCASRRPRSTEQCQDEPGAMAGQSKPQAMGAWPVCGRCGLPRVPSGLGTALKPALEPITVARKPLSEGTVAANVLQHGTGALNIDGCRVGGESTVRTGRAEMGFHGGNLASEYQTGSDAGRWPANLIHSGEPEVVALFPNSNGAGGSVPNVKVTGYGDGIGTGKSEYLGGERTKVDSGSGSAARFFYCAKASKKDRDEGLEGFDVIIHSSQSNESGLWDQEEKLVRLLVVMDNLHLKVIDASGVLSKSVTEWNTLLFGRESTGPCRQDTTFTTKTETSSTIESRILSCFQNLLTSENTVDASFETEFGGSRVESVEHGIQQITITSARTASTLGAENVPLKTRLRISVSARRNNHVTVKPTDLMRYLCRLVTPPGGVVLDPFTGSGSTGKAAMLEGFRFIGCELSPEYVAIAKARIAAACREAGR